jgi:hypothetical protein
VRVLQHVELALRLGPCSLASRACSAAAAEATVGSVPVRMQIRLCGGKSYREGSSKHKHQAQDTHAPGMQ